MGGHSSSAKKKYKDSGFTPETLGYHFNVHAKIRKDVNAKTPREYEKMAMKFRDKKITKNSDIEEFVRENGDKLRYNKTANEFIIIKSSGEIRTYYNPTNRIKYWKNEIIKYKTKG